MTVFALSATAFTDARNLLGFSIFPEVLETRQWLNTSFTDPITQEALTYSLFYGTDTNDQGVRVTDSVCYNRLLDMFTKSTIKESIIVANQSIDIIGSIVIQ